MHPGLIIRALRATSRQAQIAIAQQAGISQPYLSNIETGERGLPAHLEVPLADALGVHPDVVAGRCPVLADLRARRGLPVAVLAEAAGVDVADLVRFEAGSERPAPAVAALLAARLGVDPAALTAQPQLAHP